MTRPHQLIHVVDKYDPMMCICKEEKKTKKESFCWDTSMWLTLLSSYMLLTNKIPWRVSAKEKKQTQKIVIFLSHHFVTCSQQLVHVTYKSNSSYLQIKFHHVYRQMKKYIVHVTRWPRPIGRGGGLGSRPKKMYGERLGDGVEYHLMKPTPRR